MSETRFFKSDRKEGAGKTLYCVCCGWTGRPLELNRGKIDTPANEAFSSKICPGCGRHGKSLISQNQSDSQ